MKYSAGIAVLKEKGKKVLLVHPTDSTWKGTYSIPKGKLETNESAIAAAIRETFEETGILIPRELVEKSPQFSVLYRSNKNTGKTYKKIYYYIVNADIMNLPDVLPQSQLQLDEVDWAGFLDFTEAASRIMPKQLSIIKQLQSSL